MSEDAVSRQIQITDPTDGQNYNVTGRKIDGQVLQDVSTSLNTSDAQDFIYKFLKNTAGSADMNVNATSTAQQIFWYGPSTGANTCVNRLLIMVLDANIEPTTFGGVASLASGVIITAHDTNGTQLLDFSDGKPIANNSQWTYLAGTDAPVLDSGAGPGTDRVAVRWTIGRAGSSLNLRAGQSIRFTIQDDLSTLVEFRAMVQGINHS